MIESIEQFIGTMGFPIAITIFLLWERTKVTRQMIEVLSELRIVMAKIEGRISK